MIFRVTIIGIIFAGFGRSFFGARTLMDRGYSFDYISDSQVQQTRVEGGALITPGNRYKVIVVPATRRMPVATLQHLGELAQRGATVIFEALPEDVPGYGRLEARRAEFKQALGKLGDRVRLNRDIPAELGRHNVSREEIAESGLNFIRRATPAGAHYFYTNLTAKPYSGWTTLSVTAGAAMILDPLTGHSGLAATRTSADEKSQIYLQLTPGESTILRTSRDRVTSGEKWPYHERAGGPVALSGTWGITFVSGGPDLPPPLTTTTLASWTELGGDAVKRFAGTAKYRLEFDAPALRADDWRLDLGDVRENSRVRLNGRDVGTVWSVPFQVRVGEFLTPGRNVLELDVTNLAANRIRGLDQRQAPWKIMREINFVNINYKPFDASGWALTPSGLLGPVQLVPLRRVAP